MAHTVDRVIEVISKPSQSRLDHEIESIIPWVRKKNQLLQEREISVLFDILRNCEYLRSHKDDVIIRQGEIGECFYIILRGTVSVYIDSQKNGEDDVVSDAPTIDKKSKKKVISKANSPVRKYNGALRTKFGKFIVKFEPGRSFGELALVNKDSIRNASIIVDEETDFLVVQRDLFTRCLKVHEEKEIAAIRDFVDTHPFFNQWQRRLKRFLEMSVRKETYAYESVIVKQGEPVTALFFIYKGQARLIIDPSRHKKQYHQLWPFEAVSDLYAQEFEWLREARKDAISRKYGQDPTVIQTKNDGLMVRRLEGYAAAEKAIQGRSLNLCSVQNMEVIGDTEVVSNLETYMQTVVCSSSSQVYVLDMKNYERLVLKKNPATLNTIKAVVSAKLQSRMNTKQATQIPLLKYLHFKLNEEAYQIAKKLPPLQTTKNIPDNESLRQYLLQSFVDGKSELCEPYVPGRLYYTELMRDKARIRENIRNNQGMKRQREKLFSEKLKNRKPRSSAALKEALQLMEQDDMIAWRKHTGKDVIDIIVPTTKSNDPKSTDSPEQKRSSIKSTKMETQKKLQHAKFQFAKPEFISLPEPVNMVKAKAEIPSVLATPNKDGKSKSEKPLDKHGPVATAEIVVSKAETKANIPVLITEAPLPTIREVSHLGEPVPPTEQFVKEESDTALIQEKIGTVPTDALANQAPEDAIVERISAGKRGWNLTKQFVAKKIEKKIHNSSLFEDKYSEYKDYETSERTLNYLENRIRAFHIKYGTSRKPMKLPKLRRYKVLPEEEAYKSPRVGGKVVIKQRLCELAQSKYKIREHKHVHYHMVQSLPEVRHLRKTRMIMQFLVDKSVRKTTDQDEFIVG